MFISPIDLAVTPPPNESGSIDPFTEDVFPLNEAPKRIKGRRVHRSTV